MSANANIVTPPDEAMIEIGWVLLHRLSIPSYQREALEPRVKRLLPFRLRASGTLELSYREHVLWIVDGQARRIAAMREGLDRLPARVNYDLSEEEEALLYLYHNRNRLPVNAIDRHKAEAVAAEPRALAIDEVLKQNNLIAASTARNGYRIFRSIAKAEQVYDYGGPELLDRVLRLLDAGLPADSHRFRGNLIAGLGFFLSHDPGNATDRRVLAALQRTSGVALDEKMHHAQSFHGQASGGSYLFMAQAIAFVVYRNANWKPTKAPITEPPA